MLGQRPLLKLVEKIRRADSGARGVNASRCNVVRWLRFIPIKLSADQRTLFADVPHVIFLSSIRKKCCRNLVAISPSEELVILRPTRHPHAWKKGPSESTLTAQTKLLKRKLLTPTWLPNDTYRVLSWSMFTLKSGLSTMSAENACTAHCHQNIP